MKLGNPFGVIIRLQQVRRHITSSILQLCAWCLPWRVEAIVGQQQGSAPSTCSQSYLPASAAISSEGGGVGSKGADTLHRSHRHASLQPLLEVEEQGVPSLQLHELWAFAYHAAISYTPAVQLLLRGVKHLKQQLHGSHSHT